MQLNKTQQQLIQLIADGECHSGSELGQCLQISRSAIWKNIKQLIEFGIPIISLPQQGYKLNKPFSLLDKSLLQNHLQPLSCNLHLFNSIDSTNRFLKELAFSSEIEICCAEHQSSGRGRFGRVWHSPFAENIYCSSRWIFKDELNKLSGLSLVVGLAIIAVLKDFNIFDVQIKWPNDLYYGSQKLCGILIEILAESHYQAQVIIGIGLNVNSDIEDSCERNALNWCSLHSITQQFFNRNTLIAKIIHSLNNYITRFKQQDLSVFMEEWQSSDYLVDKKITVLQNNNQLQGTARGINEWGQLILEDEKGLKHALSSGDTSIRPGQD